MKQVNTQVYSKQLDAMFVEKGGYLACLGNDK